MATPQQSEWVALSKRNFISLYLLILGAKITLASAAAKDKIDAVFSFAVSIAHNR